MGRSFDGWRVDLYRIIAVRKFWKHFGRNQHSCINLDDGDIDIIVVSHRETVWPGEAVALKQRLVGVDSDFLVPGVSASLHQARPRVLETPTLHGEGLVELMVQVLGQIL